MKKLISILAAAAIFAGCALISPYNIIFTTPEGSVINPATDTLDLAVNIDALSYISGVDCEGYDPLELLPIVRDDMEVSKAHNLSLAMLESFEAGTQCEITVSVFDKTTTASSRDKITLHVLEKLEVAEEEPVEEAATEEETEETEEAVEEADESDELFCDDGTACPEEETTDETINEETTDDETATEAGDDSSTEE